MIISSTFYRLCEERTGKLKRSRVAARKLAEGQLLVRHEVLRDLRERRLL